MVHKIVLMRSVNFKPIFHCDAKPDIRSLSIDIADLSIWLGWYLYYIQTI